jgi:RIO kinase 1
VSLAPFFDQDLITDVEAVVKGGKEANVYRCTAHPTTGRQWLAAKVYRPRRFRALTNDTRYREGRPLLNALGGEVKETDRRLARAIDRRTGTALQAEHTSWLMYEYTTLQLLSDEGAAVPEPVAAAENALLMEYIGDGDGAALTLNQVHVDRDEAQRLFEETMKHVELMLSLGFVHGDLSAYNILYHEGRICLIDFPQVVDVHRNTGARAIFGRDVERVCDYFRRHGVQCDAERTAEEMWQRYLSRRGDDLLADESRLGISP